MKCDCCYQESKKLWKAWWTKGDSICPECFRIWFEEGIANKEEIRQRRRQQGCHIPKHTA
jgi:hypothetical protein